MAQGQKGEVIIPLKEDGSPVNKIARKAFLSSKYLRKVIVHEGVTEVGDWAFAYCDNLREVVFVGRPKFGKSVFLECRNLQKLYIGTTFEEETREAVAALLAAAVTEADAPYLLDAEEAGSKEWLQKWDARLMVILQSPDEEGYSKQVLCGEEDYGSTDIVAYKSGRRKRKVRLALLRLLHPIGLQMPFRQALEAYLGAHTKGCEGEETWQVVLSEHGEDRAYYQLFADLGCITEDNFDGLLSDVSENNPELRAFLVRYKTEKMTALDLFAELEL